MIHIKYKINFLIEKNSSFHMYKKNIYLIELRIHQSKKKRTHLKKKKTNIRRKTKTKKSHWWRERVPDRNR